MDVLHGGNLGELLARLHDSSERSTPETPPGIQAITLQELLAEREKGCTFTEGDLVQPKKCCSYSAWAGTPSIVW